MLGSPQNITENTHIPFHGLNRIWLPNSRRAVKSQSPGPMALREGRLDPSMLSRPRASQGRLVSLGSGLGGSAHERVEQRAELGVVTPCFPARHVILPPHTLHHCHPLASPDTHRTNGTMGSSNGNTGAQTVTFKTMGQDTPV